MTDHPTPDSFDEHLGARLHDAADQVDGTGVSRAGVAAAVDRNRRRQVRNRAVLVGAAAVIALLGGLAVATRSGSDGPEQVLSGRPTTTVTDPCTAPSTPVPVGTFVAWFRLSDAQADALLAADVITEAEAAGRDDHAVLLEYPDLEVINDPPIEPIGQQLFQLGSIDLSAIEFLRDAGLLTAAQETTIADSVVPAFTQDQVDRLLEHFPDLVAIPAGGNRPISGGEPGSTGPPETVGGETATTAAGSEGGTPFEEWVAILRAKELLTPEQEAEAAAGRGFALTAEQSAALQDYWDQQSAGTTTTALAFAPGPEPTTTEPDPCAGSAVTTTTGPPTTTTEAVVPTTTAPPTTTTTALAATPDGDGTWIVYLYVLNGRRNPDGTITKAIDLMGELMAGSDSAEETLAAEARTAAAGHEVFEGDLACDVGAAAALGLDPELGQLGISVGFTESSKAEAQAFADSIDQQSDTLEPLGPILVPQACAARPAPA